MGAITFSIDQKLVELIQKNYCLDVFVETGTFEGKTIEKIDQLFSEIYTIELNPKYYEKAKEKFADFAHIHVKNNDSPQSLQRLKPLLQGKKVLYWLDAHCLQSSLESCEQVAQCPLLEELNAIKYLNAESIIMIDDARLFLSPPSYTTHYSYHYESWPTITTIIDHLHQLSKFHNIIILNDVIICYPDFMSEMMINYGYKYSVDWAWIYSKAEHYDQIMKQLIEKEEVIQDRHQLLQELQQQLIEKEETIQTQYQLLQELQQQLIEKEGAIQTQHQLLQELQQQLIEKEEFIQDRHQLLQKSQQQPIEKK